MAERGVTSRGFVVPPYNDIWEEIQQLWKEKFGLDADLTHASVAGQFFRTIAEQLSNKGLTDSDILALWQELSDVYYAAYIDTAADNSLDMLVKYRGLTRNAALASTGVVTFWGSEGTEVPSGTRVQATNGATFATTAGGTITAKGYIDLPAQAEDTGETGNVGPGAITTCLSDPSLTVDNRVHSTQLLIAPEATQWTDLPAGHLDYYQVVTVNDIRHPLNLDTIQLKVKNPGTSQYFYQLQCVVLDHVTGVVIGKTEVQEFWLDAGAESTLSYSGEALNVSDYTQIRVALRLGESSTGTLQVKTSSVTPPTGAWYVGGTAQGGLWLSLTSTTPGYFTGGRDIETDLELVARYLLSLHRGGSARTAAILSELHKIPTLRSAQILENPTPDDFRPDGLPPYSIEVIVWGGTKDEILDALLQSKSAGIMTWGNRIGTIEDEYGQVHTFRYSRPDLVDIYLEVHLTTGVEFPVDGRDQVTNAIISVIGGVDLTGQFHTGLDVGEDVRISRLHDVIHNIAGVEGAHVYISRDNLSFNEADIAIGSREKAHTDTSLITYVL
jgi:uncharacterized phage protein gp47/JayE